MRNLLHLFPAFSGRDKNKLPLNRSAIYGLLNPVQEGRIFNNLPGYIAS